MFDGFRLGARGEQFNPQSRCRSCAIRFPHATAAARALELSDFPNHRAKLALGQVQNRFHGETHRAAGSEDSRSG